MLIQPNVLVLPLVPLYACILAATTPSSSFDAHLHERQSWSLPATTTYSKESAEGSATASTDVEKSPDSAAELEDTLHYASSSSSVQPADGVKKGASPCHFLSFPSRQLSFCLLVVMSAGVLAALIKRYAAVSLKKEEKEQRPSFPPELSEDINIAKGREKLEKLEKLLPAAARLAAVLKTEEAGGLLTTIEKTLAAARRQTNADALELSVSASLSALQRLHDRATENTRRLFLADRLFIDLKQMEEWAENTNKILSELQNKELQDAVKPFVDALISLFPDVQKISKRINEERERLSAERRTFKSESDGDLLLSAARDLECMYTSSETKRHLLEFAVQMQKYATDIVKGFLIAEREKDSWGLDVKLASLHARHALAKSLMSAAGSSVADTPQGPHGGPEGGPQGGPLGGLSGGPLEGPDEGSIENTVKSLEEQIAGASNAERELEASALSLQLAPSLQAAVAINFRALELVKQAEEFLAKGAAAAEGIPLPSGPLDSSQKEILGGASRWLEKSVEKEKGNLLGLIGYAESNSVILSRAADAGRTLIGKDIIKKQQGLMYEAAKSAFSRTVQTASTVNELKEPRAFDSSFELLGEALKSIKAQTEGKRSLWVASLKVSFLQAVENNLSQMNLMMREMERLGHQQQVGGPRESYYKELQKEMHAAKGKVRDAATLEQAARAAADVRAAAIKMQDFLFNSK